MFSWTTSCTKFDLTHRSMERNPSLLSVPASVVARTEPGHARNSNRMQTWLWRQECTKKSIGEASSTKLLPCPKRRKRTRSEASVSSSSTQDSSEQDELSQDERTREEFRLYREMAEKYRRDLKVRYRLKLFSVAFFLTCAFGLLTLAIGPLFPYRAFIASVSIVSFLASSGLTVFLYLQKTSTLSEPAISLVDPEQFSKPYALRRCPPNHVERIAGSRHIDA
jgi:hypothetical protein